MNNIKLALLATALCTISRASAVETPATTDAATESADIEAQTDSLPTQQKKSVVKKVEDAFDHILELHDRYFPPRQPDTVYMERLNKGWALKVSTQVNSSFTHSKLIADYFSLMDSDGQEVDIARATTTTPLRSGIGIALNYQTLGLSFNLKPYKLLSKSSDYSFQFGSTGNRMGFEFTYNSYGDLDHRQSGTTNDKLILLPTKRRNIYLSGYYVFNHKKFSYAAALKQTWRQNRSAGSIIAGATYFRNKLHEDISYTIDFGFDDDDILPITNNIGKVITTAYGFSLNAGYGYNLVTNNKKWLFHLSVIPGLVLFNEYRQEISMNPDIFEDEEEMAEEKYYDHSPYANIFFTGNASIVHYMKKGYLSFTTRIRSIFMNEVSGARSNNSEWNAKLSYGFNL